ncbi:MAG: tyrosine-type recombinase/integrase, partial [Bacteroidetes bacterium]|nr:tyrosine-type recombinase/integrase [Bacteroidota bacterium]
ALTTEPVVLSQAEIGLLYKACDDTHIGIRDRAMLAVYYGCGLRKSEGLYLELPDVLFERRLLYVRKTKNNYERYVPMSRGVMTDIENYIYGSRPLLIARTNNENTLFISERGGRMNPESMVKRLQAIREKTGCPDLQQKSFGLHALRHSIATHLLQKGMDIENIAIFLGHRTLDSTQRYTHLVNELH